jgi:hypothetical protein
MISDLILFYEAATTEDLWSWGDTAAGSHYWAAEGIASHNTTDRAAAGQWADVERRGDTNARTAGQGEEPCNMHAGTFLARIRDRK